MAAEMPAIFPDGFFRMIWALALVLGIILLLYGLSRKRFSILTGPSDNAIKVLEVKPLMGKKALCLVAVRDQEFLLGINADSIAHLATLKPQDSSDFEKILDHATEGGVDES